jgi:hypothetical protein
LKRYQEKFREKILLTYEDLKKQTSSLSVRSDIEKEEEVSKEYKKTLDKPSRKRQISPKSRGFT